MKKGTRTAFLDMLFVLLMVFMLLPNNPKESDSDNKKSDMVIEITWDEVRDVDVDLWVQSPGDLPIGYSRKNGRYMDLLRDDLGHTNDVSNLNYEIVFSRGPPSGEYIINLHFYSNHESGSNTQYSKSVAVDVKVHTLVANSMKRVISKQVKLEYQGQEITVVRFQFNNKNGYVSNQHNLFKELRSAEK